MNIKQIEVLINDSLNNSSINKINSTQIFEQIKNDSNKWNIGLELFYSSSSDVAKLFGLTRKLFLFLFSILSIFFLLLLLLLILLSFII